jgi:hypothetical protein
LVSIKDFFFMALLYKIGRTLSTDMNQNSDNIGRLVCAFSWRPVGGMPSGTDPTGGKEFVGNRWNDVHLTLARKKEANS